MPDTASDYAKEVYDELLQSYNKLQEASDVSEDIDVYSLIKETLEFYADEMHWDGRLFLEYDMGEKARLALEKLNGVNK